MEDAAQDVEMQLEEGDGLRVLVVGAGIAGMTTAQLLRADGHRVALVERSVDGSSEGYMLALMPMVDRTLRDLGATERYRAVSTPLATFGMWTHRGTQARSDSVDDIMRRFGDYRGIARGDLLDVLEGDGCGVQRGTTVHAIDDRGDRVDVTLDRAGVRQQVTVDAVVVADGLGSRTRALVQPTPATSVVNTGWGGWVLWVPSDDEPARADELWGAGAFMGAYPVLGRLGAFVGGPLDDLHDPASFAGALRSRLRHVGPRFGRVLDALERAEDPYLWRLADVRAERWAHGRITLVGDAAAGFLPTAGIGAGMAIESAGVLARRLTQAAPAEVPAALAAFERTQRPRVESAQDNSRQLARLMFHRGRAFAAVRDVAMRLMSVDAALRPIQRLLADPPR